MKKQWHYFQLPNGIGLGKVFDALDNIKADLKRCEVRYTIEMRGDQALFTLLNRAKL